MGDFNSKYTGEQVEALLDIVSQGGSSGGGGGTITEAEITAMGFTKNQGTITEVKMNGVSKGTSGVVDLGEFPTKEQFDSLVDTTDSINGDVAALYNDKQNTITDLATIREGASKGATALQSIPSEYITETELTAKGYATTAQLSDKVDKVSGKGLSTEDFTTALKSKLEGLSNYDDTTLSNALTTLRNDLDKLVSGDSTTAIKTFNEIIAFLDGIADTEDLASIIASIEQQIGNKVDKVSGKGLSTNDYTTTEKNKLAGIASGAEVNVQSDWSETNTSSDAYIKNKPTIPSAVTESTVSGWGFTKNTGTYSKPSGGIPKSDLATSVQESLSKAESAAQMGVTGELTVVETRALDDGAMVYATPSAANGDEDDILLSRDSVKTINGQSIFGSGNITIEGGGSSSGGGKEIVEADSHIDVALPEVIYFMTNSVRMRILDFELPTNGLYGEYTFMFHTFDVGLETPSLSIPDYVVWANGNAPTLEEEVLYELSVVYSCIMGYDCFSAVLTPFKPA